MKHSRRILVVDDQEGIREQLAKFICRSTKKDKTASLIQKAKARLLGIQVEDDAPADGEPDYVVDTAAQGNDAYDMVKEAVERGDAYRVIFLDMRMPPGWDGLETMERIWQVDANVQIVLCSAYSDYSWNSIIDRVGRRDNLLILKKPFDVAEVSQMAMALTEKHILAEETRENAGELQRVNQELRQQVVERECIGDALRYTRNYLNSVFQSMPSILVSVDAQGTINQWNAAAEAFSGTPSAQALSQSVWDLLPLLQDYREDFQRAFDSGKSVDSRGARVGEGADCLFMDISFYPITYLIEESSAEGVQGIVIRIDDVTELERKNEHLRQAQKMDTVGKLAAGLAHDFKNVIGGIKGTVSSMKFTLEDEAQDIGEETKESLLEDIDIIEESSKNGQELIKRLLTMSSKKQELSFTEVNLVSVVKSVIKVCQNAIAKTVAIHADFDVNTAMVQAYPSQLEQVLLNLCVNASHAMTIMRSEKEHRGGDLTVDLEQVVADKTLLSMIPGAREGASYWRLSVSDTGVGIQPGTLSKIFDPFFTTKEKGQGSGLGLSMVYNIIKQHAGFLDVKSEVGKGSTFNVYLPVVEGEEASPPDTGARVA